MRAVQQDVIRRLPGGVEIWLLGLLGLLTLVGCVVAAATAYVAVLVPLPALVAVAGLVVRGRRRRTELAGGAGAALALVAGVLVARTSLDGGSAGVLGGVTLTVLLVAAVAEVCASRTASLETALQVARDTVDAVSVRDPLTGVANGHGLELVGRQIVETARRQGDAVHCTFVEVEGLDEARSRRGPDQVCEVLVALAESLRAVTRATDVVARWQDSIFCIVGQGTGVEPSELERRVRRRLGADDGLDRSVWSGRIAVGGAMLPPWDSGTLETLLMRAAEELRARSVSRRPRSAAASPDAP